MTTYENYNENKNLNVMEDYILQQTIDKHYNNKTREDDQKLSPFDLIPYAIGSFDRNRKPTQAKVKHLAKKIIGKHSTINVLEGGVRGGKDVFGLWIWSLILMASRNKTHLALGTSLEHVLRTVFVSDEFGLKNLIPHGKLIRDTESGGVRAVFKFKNMYGEDREVIFYGNYKKDDYKKYQGFTIGTCYINEGILQHINGIYEAFQRMISSKDQVIIITQNPVGTSHKFYTDIENNYILSRSEIEFIENLQQDKAVNLKWLTHLQEINLKVKKTMKETTDKYLEERQKTNIKDLSLEEKDRLTVILKNIKADIEDGLEFTDDKGEKTKIYGKYDVPLEKFVEIPKSFVNFKSKLIGASMYKIMKYDKYFKENINNVVNGYDYSYFHFTMEDNIGMNEMQRNNASKKWKEGTPTFEQRVLGKRVSSDGLLLPEFTQDNIIIGKSVRDVEEEIRLKNPNIQRMIAIDPGYNHPTAIVDADVDLVNGMIYVLAEAKVEMKDFSMENRNIGQIEKALYEVIRSRSNRKMPDMLILDPSNVNLISTLGSRGFNVVRASNRTQSSNPKDQRYGDITIKANEKGVDLIKQGLLRLKFMFHENCPETIAEMSSVSVKFNETTGKEDIIKIKDDMFDAFKYIANTSGISPQTWQESEVLNEYERELLQNDEEEEEIGDLDYEERRKRIEQKINKLIKTKSISNTENYERTIFGRFDDDWWKN